MNTTLKEKSKKIIIAVTGASGSIYAYEAIRMSIKSEAVKEIALIFSSYGEKVWKYENMTIPVSEKLTFFSNEDLFAPPSSGSALYDIMFIIPCSMGTLGKIANGIADNLITRAADVMLKEKRQLWLAIRETPYNSIHLKNMKTVVDAGGGIFPLSPFFYHHPQEIADLIQPLVSRLLHLAGIVEPIIQWKK
ncbi:MAG: UbiX family flavin prenyltransferase [Bacteroidales bacterium]|nr:UbiX family flavin prenyltransferase [Bacteroidales bacterium]